MMQDPIQAHMRQDVLCAGRGRGYFPSFTVMLARPISDVVPCR
jgi:hypothetical protein